MFLEHARLVIERSLRCGGFPKVRLLFFKQLKFFRRNALSRGAFRSSRRVRDCWHGSCFNVPARIRVVHLLSARTFEKDGPGMDGKRRTSRNSLWIKRRDS